MHTCAIKLIINFKMLQKYGGITFSWGIDWPVYTESVKCYLNTL